MIKLFWISLMIDLSAEKITIKFLIKILLRLLIIIIIKK